MKILHSPESKCRWIEGLK